MSAGPPKEQLWQVFDTSTDLLRLLFPDQRSIRSDDTRRKLRLTCCAAARLVWSRLSDERSRSAVEATELHSDGLIKSQVWTASRAAGRVAAIEARRRYHTAISTTVAHAARSTGGSEYLLEQSERHRDYLLALIGAVASQTRLSILDVVGALRSVPLFVMPDPPVVCGDLEEYVEIYEDHPPDPLPAVLRDIFGNPFRPVKLNKKWLTSTVVGLADAMTAGGAFDRLPVLADALEEAGCTDADVLGHARGPGPHVRGGWVVDLVRGVHWQPQTR